MPAIRISQRHVLFALLAALPACTSVPPAVPAGPVSRSVAAGTTWTVAANTTLDSLSIAPQGALAAPPGKSLTMTVDGVETDIAPGSYSGHIALSVTDEFVVPFSMMGSTPKLQHFRQALYLDGSGVVANRSVLSAAAGYRLQDGVLSGVKLRSVGEDFNGLVVTGGQYTVQDAVIDFTGNGGNDFSGFGAAVLTRGAGTRLVLKGAKIHTHGVIRTAAVADEGSQLIVMNSELSARDGTLPAGYVSNVTPGEMKDVPWMLGLSGNVRATNLLGTNTTATYINSSISSDRWGVLSVDASRNARLTTIDSTVANLGNSGYGSYAIGDSRNEFYGTTFDVADYGVIVTGGDALFAASTPANLARVNSGLALGLDNAQLQGLAGRSTRVKSRRFGVMWHGDGSVTVRDGTVFDTAETVFLVKGVKAAIDVDGAGGARFNPRNGVLLQLMDDDDPGPVMQNGLQANVGVYHEPQDAASRVAGFDVAAHHDSDVVAKFAHIALKGDFFNSTRGGAAVGGGAPPSSAAGPGVIGAGAPGDAPPAGNAQPGGRNLILVLQDATLTGTVTASTAHHSRPVITAADYKLLGEVSNSAGAVVNNGVQVELQQSTWTVTGTSFLSRLIISPGSRVLPPPDQRVRLTVNGETRTPAPGDYQGQVVLRIVKD